MSQVAIHAVGLGKQYRIGRRRQSYRTLREALVNAFVAPVRRAGKLLRGQATGAAELDEIFWALKDVSFDVYHGEVVGIIGPNGAGKSTLLKVLSRITEPSEGYAEIRGRVGSLLEVGTGFHPELTGRENIYLNGAILGMRKREIERKFDEIVAFAEIEQFLDTPVKHYSSGMYVRLAFAVAAHLDPEILLVDEVLAVGDVAFQKKCLGKMGHVAREGRTVLFVSHNMGAITQLCGRTVWLENGQVKTVGESEGIVEAYLQSSAQHSSVWVGAQGEKPDSEVVLESVRVLTLENQPTPVVAFDKGFKIEIGYEVLTPIRDLAVLCRVTNSLGQTIWTSWDRDTTVWNGQVRDPGYYFSVCHVPGKLLRPAGYFLSVGCHIPGVKSVVPVENILAFQVSEVGYPLNLTRQGIVTPLLEWQVTRAVPNRMVPGVDENP